jgi:hypothetical protein
LAVRFDVIAVQDALAFPGQDGAETLLALDQWTVRQILAVAVQQVEGDEARLATAEQEIVKLGLALVIKANDLAVEDDRPFQFGGERFRQ